MLKIEKLNRILLRVLKLAYLNFLWIGGTLIGLVIFGIGPATLSVFSIIREWFRGNDDLPVFKTFVLNYKTYYKKGLILSLVYGVVGIILVVDFAYVSRWELRVFFGMMLFFYYLSLSYLLPILVHYDLKTLKESIKYSFLIGFSYLQYTLVSLVVIVAIYIMVARLLPALFTFFGFSVVFFILMGNANMVFNRIEESAKKEMELTN